MDNDVGIKTFLPGVGQPCLRTDSLCSEEASVEWVYEWFESGYLI